jgi:hypothetical protein
MFRARAAGDRRQPDDRAAVTVVGPSPRAVLGAALLAALAGGVQPATPPSVTSPAYTAEGALLFPEDYQKWVFVGASLGLSYADQARTDGPGAFHNVYLRPESYDAFRRTGRFPDGTVLVMELYEAAGKVAPSRHGLFEGRRLAVEAAVKDTKRFPEGWAYFGFGDGPRRSAAAFPRGSCFDCHRQHAATDNVFTQFYPVLRNGGH